MQTIRSYGSRFKELTESDEYKKAFRGLKKQILSFKVGSKYSPDLPLFFKLDVKKTFETGWRYQVPIALNKVQRWLRKGTVNNEWVMLSDQFIEFKKKWGVEFVYDPLRDTPEGFNPCIFSTPPIQLVMSSGGEFPPIVTFKVDLRYSWKVLTKHLQRQVKKYQTALGITGRPEKYSDHDIYQVRKYMKEGRSKPIEIFREIHPECKGFNLMEDYILNPEDDKHYDCWSKYQKIKRLVDRAKKRVP